MSSLKVWMPTSKLALVIASTIIWSIAGCINKANAASIRFDSAQSNPSQGTYIYDISVPFGETVQSGDIFSLTGLSGVNGQNVTGITGSSFTPVGFTSSSAQWRANSLLGSTGAVFQPAFSVASIGIIFDF